ncbi:MAG: hypothetical protein WC657_09315 [Candidatus Paceibacterota bacterium]
MIRPEKIHRLRRGKAHGGTGVDRPICSSPSARISGINKNPIDAVPQPKTAGTADGMSGRKHDGAGA